MSTRVARRFTGQRLVIASHNAGKVREIGALLRPFGVAVTSAAERGLPEPEETGVDFMANALIKARAAASAAATPALADDSGLVVPALGGAPGIHSARWAGPERDFRKAMARLERALPQDSDRAAHFVSALALVWPNGHAECFEGRVDGVLVWPPRGLRGFGYDAMFVAHGQALTFGEMEPEAKDAISHRANAFAKLVAACFRA